MPKKCNSTYVNLRNLDSGTAEKKVELKIVLVYAWIFLFFILQPKNLLAQKNSDNLNIMDEIDHYEKDPYYQPIYFKNIGIIPYFYQGHKVTKILKLQSKNKTEKLIKELEKYVSQFGIQNFYKDTDMLWALGQLYEQSNRKEDAKILYRFVLRHLDDSVNEVRVFYDSLVYLDEDYYVPVKYYYDLVGEKESVDTIFPPDVYLNMGTDVNSNMADYGPSINLAGDKLIFSSKRNRVKEASI